MARVTLNSSVSSLLSDSTDASVRGVLTGALRNGLLHELAQESVEVRDMLRAEMFAALERALTEQTTDVALDYLFRVYPSRWPFRAILRRVMDWLLPERLLTLLRAIIFRSQAETKLDPATGPYSYGV